MALCGQQVWHVWCLSVEFPNPSTSQLPAPPSPTLPCIFLVCRLSEARARTELLHCLDLLSLKEALSTFATIILPSLLAINVLFLLFNFSLCVLDLNTAGGCSKHVAIKKEDSV